jgi:negative regulator of sigma E activity
VIPWASQPAYSQTSAAEEQVLNEMDKSSADFRSAQASLDVDLYTSLVKETETQKGNIYFRRQGSDTQMMLEIIQPPQSVLVSGGKLQLFEPKANRVTVYDLSKHQDEYESLLKLGFGGGGHALLKSFELKYLGTEKVAGIDAAKFDLVPKNPKVQNMVPHIVLWIDPARGVAVQQQLFEQGGEDYRLSKYSGIALERKIPDAVFQLKTDGKTTFQNM